MRKLQYIYELAMIRRVIDKCEHEETKDGIKQFFIELQNQKKDYQSPARALAEISANNSEQFWVSLLYDYVNTISVKDKIKIKRGDEAVAEYTKTLRLKPLKKNNVSAFHKEFWMSKGYTEQEAREKQKEIHTASINGRTKDSYKNQKSKMKHSLHYWTSRGHSKEEAEILRRPHLEVMLNDEASLVRRHGEENGKLIYQNKIKKYKDTCKQNFPNKKSAGYVSRESLRFFIPLYKKCRRLGIERKDICLGVNGSKEFFLRYKGQANTGRFFDFCIKSLRIIIEYNGTFWHPREQKDWKNPWISFDDAVAIELEKEMLCESNDFRLYKVWSDDNLEEKAQELLKIIGELHESATSV